MENNKFWDRYENEEENEEEEEFVDPLEEVKDFVILLKDGSSAVLPFKNAKHCRRFMDIKFTSIPKLEHEVWAVKRMIEFLMHYDKTPFPQTIHPARKLKIENLTHLMPFLSPEEAKKPVLWQLNFLNILNYLLGGNNEDIIDDWLARYLVNLSLQEHSEMIKLAEFVLCRPLHDHLCASFAIKYLINLPADEMRKLLKVENDFSENEQKKLKYHFVWDELVDWEAMKLKTPLEYKFESD